VKIKTTKTENLNYNNQNNKTKIICGRKKDNKINLMQAKIAYYKIIAFRCKIS